MTNPSRLRTVRTHSDDDIVIVVSPATADALDGLYRFLHGAKAPNQAVLFEYGRQLGAVVKSIEAELLGEAQDRTVEALPIGSEE